MNPSLPLRRAAQHALVRPGALAAAASAAVALLLAAPAQAQGMGDRASLVGNIPVTDFAGGRDRVSATTVGVRFNF